MRYTLKVFFKLQFFLCITTHVVFFTLAAQKFEQKYSVSSPRSPKTPPRKGNLPLPNAQVSHLKEKYKKSFINVDEIMADSSDEKEEDQEVNYSPSQKQLIESFLNAVYTGEYQQVKDFLINENLLNLLNETIVQTALDIASEGCNDHGSPNIKELLLKTKTLCLLVSPNKPLYSITYKDQLSEEIIQQMQRNYWFLNFDEQVFFLQEIIALRNGKNIIADILTIDSLYLAFQEIFLKSIRNNSEKTIFSILTTKQYVRHLALTTLLTALDYTENPTIQPALQAEMTSRKSPSKKRKKLSWCCNF